MILGIEWVSYFVTSVIPLPARVVSCSPTIAVLNLLVFMAVNSPGFPQINCMLHIQPHFRKGIRLKPGSPRASEKLAVSSTSNRA